MTVIREIYDFLSGCHGDDAVQQSHRILEIILYEAQVNLVSGRRREAKEKFVERMKGHDQLTITDLCVGWIACVHVMAFDVLPSHMFDPIMDNPSKIANKVTV